MDVCAGTKSLLRGKNQDQIRHANGDYCNKLLPFSALYFLMSLLRNVSSICLRFATLHIFVCRKTLVIILS